MLGKKKIYIQCLATTVDGIREDIALVTVALTWVEEKAEDNPVMSILMVGDIGHALMHNILLLFLNAECHYCHLIYHNMQRN